MSDLGHIGTTMTMYALSLYPRSQNHRRVSVLLPGPVGGELRTRGRRVLLLRGPHVKRGSPGGHLGPGSGGALRKPGGSRVEMSGPAGPEGEKGGGDS